MSARQLAGPRERPSCLPVVVECAYEPESQLPASSDREVSVAGAAGKGGEVAMPQAVGTSLKSHNMRIVDSRFPDTQVFSVSSAADG